MSMTAEILDDVVLKARDLTVNYSRGERQLFELLPKDGTKISSTDLTASREKRYKWDIDNPRNAVSVTMTSLMQKIVRNREPFRLRKTPQRGPYPVEFWIEMLRKR
jgi:hypothetical protein